MRISIFVASVALLSVGFGCGDSTPPKLDGGGTDSGSHADLASGGDMATAAKLKCNAIVDCLVNGAGDLTTCLNMAAPASRTKFINALSCGQNWCLGTNDAGPADCKLDNTGMMLVDNPGKPATCQACLGNALQGLFGPTDGSTCMPNASDPNCNPAMCTALYTTCVSEV